MGGVEGRGLWLGWLVVVSRITNGGRDAEWFSIRYGGLSRTLTANYDRPLLREAPASDA